MGKEAYNTQKKGVFAEKGARFRGKWGLGAPSPPQKFPVHTPGPPPPPPPPPGFSVKPPPPPRRGGGGEWPGVGGGGAEAPFTAKTNPFFGENALKSYCRHVGKIFAPPGLKFSSENEKFQASHPQCPFVVRNSEGCD